MRARDVMTSKVATVGPDDTLADIVEALAEREVSAVPVVEDGQIIGMVSEGDLLRRRELGTARHSTFWHVMFTDPDTLAHEYIKSRGIRARDIMSTPVISVDPDSTLQEIAQIMEEKHIKRVPVLDAGRLVGIVTRADLVRALSWRRAKSPRQDDAAIRNTMQQRLECQPWADPGMVSVIVQDGAVSLSGFVRSQEQVRAVTVMAESIPGVVTVAADLIVRPQVPLSL